MPLHCFLSFPWYSSHKFLALQTVPPWTSGLPIIPFAYPTVVLVEKRREAARRAGLSFYNNPGKKINLVWKRRKIDRNIDVHFLHNVECGLRYQLQNTMQCCGSWFRSAWICIDFVRLDPVPGEQKDPQKKKKGEEISCLEWGIEAALVA